MPAIITTTVAGMPLDKILQDVLDTQPSEWNYFFQQPNFIKDIFEKLASTVRSRNFFSEDYSINTFLGFIKFYVSVKLTKNNLINIDSDILQKFNDLWISIQNRIIQQRGLNEEKCGVIKTYIGFVNTLLGPQHRDLFSKSEITFTANDFQSLAVMLQHNSLNIKEDLIESYTLLLKLSFDTPKFLTNFEGGLGINPLAKTIFSNKQINSDFAITRFFSLLGYQGQLLYYYHNKDSRFNISSQFLDLADKELREKALELQLYFFNNLQKRDDIDKPLLQHYLYTYFFKVIYKEYPQKLGALKRDSYILNYIKLDYVALPNRLDCRDYLPKDYKVTIEYKDLPSNTPVMACQAMACSSKSHEQWQKALGFHVSAKSNYIFRVADSYKKYSVTYAYGYAPTAGGFYLSGIVENNTVNGEAYSYFNDNHQFIEVSRHEAVHHDNFRLLLAAQKFNNEIISLINRNFNEGLALLFSGGACAPGYNSQDFSNVTAPELETLLDTEYIGYSTSWLYNNYFIQQYSDSNENFYSDLLHLSKTVFKNKWSPILHRDKVHFVNWLAGLKQACQNAPTALSVKDCPSIHLKNYLSMESNKQTTTMTTSKVSESPNLGFLLPKKLTSDQMGRELIFKISERKFDEFRTLLENGANPNLCEETTGNMPLHFLYYYGNCDIQYLELLLKNGAKITPNLQGQFPLQLAEKTCNAMELLKIQETLTRHAQQQKLPLTIVMPIASFVNGTISGWSGEIAQRNSRSYIPSIIFYGLKPVTLAMINSAINLVFAGSAEVIGLDDVGISFTCYLIMNYLGLMFAQFGEQISNKLQNKFLNIVMSILLYTFFLNPSLLVLLISEGFMALNVQSILPPFLSLLSGGIFFKAGEYSGQKFYQKFFPINSSNAATSQQDYFLCYSLDQAKKRISVEEKTLQEIKNKLEHLQKMLKKHIDEQAYILSFDKNFVVANNNLLLLLNKCQENGESYREIFKTFKENLINIQKNLYSLLKKIQSRKDKLEINTLWNEITNILPLVSQIQPLPLVQKPFDLVANHGTRVTVEEEQLLSSIKSINGKANGYPGAKTFRNTRPPTMLEKMYTFFVRPGEQKSEYPEPPTQEQLHEMGFTKENNRKFNLNRS